MSYIAFVYCNCLKEGKTKPYPFEFGFSINEEGGIEPDIPFTANEKERSAFRRDRSAAIRRWMQDCCDHENMYYADENVANIYGMATFRGVLVNIGWEYFPALKQGLPHPSAWITSPALAQQMLEELDFLRTRIKALVPNYHLTDLDDTLERTSTMCQASVATGNPIYWLA